MHPPYPPAGATRPGYLLAEAFGFVLFYLRLSIIVFKIAYPEQPSQHWQRHPPCPQQEPRSVAVFWRF